MGRKWHVLVDTLGLIHYLYVTPADVQDRDAACDLLEAVLSQDDAPAVIWADGGYAGAPERLAEEMGATVAIVRRRGRAFEVLAKRWIVERTFAWAVSQRRVRCDFERLEEATAAWLSLGMTRRMAAWLN